MKRLNAEKQAARQAAPPSGDRAPSDEEWLPDGEQAVPLLAGDLQSDPHSDSDMPPVPCLPGCNFVFHNVISCRVVGRNHSDFVSVAVEIIVIACRWWAEVSTCEIDLDVNSCS